MDLQLPLQSVPINPKVVSSNPVHGEVYSIQNYVIKFVNDLRHVSGFLWVLRFPPPIKLTSHDIAEILLKVALNTINYQPPSIMWHCYWLKLPVWLETRSFWLIDCCLPPTLTVFHLYCAIILLLKLPVWLETKSFWLIDWCLTPTSAVFHL